MKLLLNDAKIAKKCYDARTDPGEGLCYAGKKPDNAVAFYHSHGKPVIGDTSPEHFSTQDIDGFDEDKLDGYVVTPVGRSAEYEYGPKPPDKRDGDERFDNVRYFNPENGKWEKVLLYDAEGVPLVKPSIPLKDKIQPLPQ